MSLNFLDLPKSKCQNMSKCQNVKIIGVPLIFKSPSPPFIMKTKMKNVSFTGELIGSIEATRSFSFEGSARNY